MCSPGSRSASARVFNYERKLWLYLGVSLDQLQLPGTTTVENPTTEGWSHERADIQTGQPAEWEFALESFELTTTATEIVPCEGLEMTLKNATFRYVDWQYDENGEQVDVPSNIKLRINSIPLSSEPYDESCSSPPSP